MQSACKDWQDRVHQEPRGGGCSEMLVQVELGEEGDADPVHVALLCQERSQIHTDPSVQAAEATEGWEHSRRPCPRCLLAGGGCGRSEPAVLGQRSHLP